MEYIQLHPNVPNEDHYQLLVTTSSDLLMDHSRNIVTGHGVVEQEAW